MEIVRDTDVCMIHQESLGRTEAVRDSDVCMIHLEHSEG